MSQGSLVSFKTIAEQELLVPTDHAEAHFDGVFGSPQLGIGLKIISTETGVALSEKDAKEFIRRFKCHREKSYHPYYY